jgi:hypothetical protein
MAQLAADNLVEFFGKHKVLTPVTALPSGVSR